MDSILDHIMELVIFMVIMALWLCMKMSLLFEIRVKVCRHEIMSWLGFAFK
jgi:hypothetical protein